MKALVTLSARFDRGPDGRIYPQNPVLGYDFFTRYLDVFEEILVLARVRQLAEAPAGNKPSDGPGVAFMELPLFTSAFDLFKFLPRIRKILRQAIPQCQAYFLRVPDFLGDLAWKEIRRCGLPFAVEVVGNPADSLKSGSIRHPLRPLIRFLAIRNLRAQCVEACGAAYVTKSILQKRYPPGEQTFSTYYSSIDLPGAFFIPEPRKYLQPATSLIYVGTLEVFYKGPDVLVDSLNILAARGLSLHLTYVGDGRRRPELEARVQDLGLHEQVTFLGKVPAGEGVAAALDAAHLFILPSKTEGMPKAMIEAMSRGLPCIGTTAGGFPELLPAEDLTPPGDPQALAQKIEEVVQDPAKLTRMSARNLAAAREYQLEVLRARRVQFYRHVRTLMENQRPRRA